MRPSRPFLLLRRRKLLLMLFATCVCVAQRAPMVVDYPNSASYRWQNKKVLESRPLDDMEKLDKWTAFTRGAPAVVDARVSIKPADAPKMVAEMTLTKERSRDGGQSLRFRSPTRLDGPGPVNGRGWGSSGVIRHFDGEDWQKFNRISLWIYPDCPGTYHPALAMHLHNDGSREASSSLRSGGRELHPLAQPGVEPRGVGDRQRSARQGHRA